MRSLLFILSACAVIASNVVVASSIVLVEPSSPRSYERFVADVTFDATYCVSASYPLIGEGALQGNVFSVTLSHLKPGPCSKTFRVNIPGLPVDVTRLRVSMTKTPSPAISPAVIAESVELGLTLNGYRPGERKYTVRVESDGVYNPFHVPEDGTRSGPIVLWWTTGAPATGAGEWMEVGTSHDTAFTFRYLAVDAPYASEDIAQLFSVYYPDPWRGLYYTTDFTLAQKLSSAWHGRDAVGRGGFVGRQRGGVCPVGMSAVYQAFHPAAEVAHRYTQSKDAYHLLMQNGYIGEGPAWCAPER